MPFATLVALGHENIRKRLLCGSACIGIGMLLVLFWNSKLGAVLGTGLEILGLFVLHLLENEIHHVKSMELSRLRNRRYS